MGCYTNVQTLVDNRDNCNDNFSKVLNDVFSFTKLSSRSRDIVSILPFFSNIKRNYSSDFKYFFVVDGKKYCFSVFSDWEIQEYDKEVLEGGKREEEAVARSLKLACSMDFIDPRIAMGNSLSEVLKTLILFQEGGVDKVIDYSKNIVMNKDDYYNLFNYYELNVVDYFDLYNIYFIIKEFNYYENIYDYLLYTKDIFEELSKIKNLQFLKEKYDINGINRRNYVLFGNNSDCLFFGEGDICQTKYGNLKNELDEFTKNPGENTEHISYNQKLGVYELEDESFGFLTFKLLSDIVCDQELKDKLLSDSRYHKCHQNSILVANSLTAEEKKSAYIVGGKFRENDCDYFHHSWVEIEEKNLVIDFNSNLIMNRDKYYKLFEVKPIAKTLVTKLNDTMETISSDGVFDFHVFLINYFGEEIISDLKKNEKVLRK